MFHPKNIQYVSRFVIYLLVGLFSHSFLVAQYSEAGVKLGFASYWGDLSLPTNYDNLTHNSRFAVGAEYRYVVNRTIGISGFLGYSQLHGDDAYSSVPLQRLRNLNFTTPLWQLGGMLEVYPFGFARPIGDVRIYPFFTIGISGICFNPSTTYKGVRYALQPLGTEGQGLPSYPDYYNLVSLAIPLGGGFKWAINDDWSLNLAAIVSRSSSDYIDDVSTNYADHAKLYQFNGPLSAVLANRTPEYLGSNKPVIFPAGAQRGSQIVKDYFMHITLGIHMRITDMMGRMKAFRGIWVKCPAVSR